MILNLKVGYVVRVGMLKEANGQDSYWAHERQISEFLVRNALIAKFPEGSEKSAKKKNARVLNALSRAVNDKRDSVDLERNLVEHVQDALAAWAKCSVDLQPWLVDLEDEVEAALKRADAAEKASEASKNGAEKSLEPSKA